MLLNDNNYYTNYTSYPTSADVFEIPLNGQDFVTDDQWNKLASSVIATQTQAIGILGNSHSTAAKSIGTQPNPFQLPFSAPAVDRGKLVAVGYTTVAQTNGQGYTCNIWTPSGYILYPNSLQVRLASKLADGTPALPHSCKLWVSSINYTKEATRNNNTFLVSIHNIFALPVTGTRTHLVVTGHMIAVGA